MPIHIMLRPSTVRRMLQSRREFCFIQIHSWSRQNTSLAREKNWQTNPEQMRILIANRLSDLALVTSESIKTLNPNTLKVITMDEIAFTRANFPGSGLPVVAFSPEADVNPSNREIFETEVLDTLKKIYVDQFYQYTNPMQRANLVMFFPMQFAFSPLPGTGSTNLLRRMVLHSARPHVPTANIGIAIIFDQSGNNPIIKITVKSEIATPDYLGLDTIAIPEIYERSMFRALMPGRPLQSFKSDTGPSFVPNVAFTAHDSENMNLLFGICADMVDGNIRQRLPSQAQEVPIHLILVSAAQFGEGPSFESSRVLAPLGHFFVADTGAHLTESMSSFSTIHTRFAKPESITRLIRFGNDDSSRMMIPLGTGETVVARYTSISIASYQKPT